MCFGSNPEIESIKEYEFAFLVFVPSLLLLLYHNLKYQYLYFTAASYFDREMYLTPYSYCSWRGI